MADVNRGNRPLSPHLTVYRPQITSMLSILHRVTGVGLTLGAILIVWWFFAAATSEAYFETIDGLMTSWIGHLVWLGLTFSLAYHFCNGIRHLMWDIGYGFELEQVENSGKIVVGAACVLTVLVWLIA